MRSESISVSEISDDKPHQILWLHRIRRKFGDYPVLMIKTDSMMRPVEGLIYCHNAISIYRLMPKALTLIDYTASVSHVSGDFTWHFAVDWWVITPEEIPMKALLKRVGEFLSERQKSVSSAEEMRKEITEEYGIWGINACLEAGGLAESMLAKIKEMERSNGSKNK